MHKEFRAILSLEDKISSLKKEWPLWVEKLLKFAKIESSSRPALKKLIDELETTVDVDKKEGED